MELDPIVLLAYVSVAVNLITLLVAAIAYAIFRVRRARPARRMPAAAAPSHEPVFLTPYRPDPVEGGKGPAAVST